MKQTDLSLVVPGLLDIPVGEFDPDFLSSRLAGINYCLTHANRVDTPVTTLDETIAECLGLGQRSLPMVQAMSESDLYSPGRSMLLEPVYLKPDISNVTVFPIERTAETAEQIGELVAALQYVFSDDLEATAVNDWVHLVRFKTLQAPDYYPHPLSILGKTINRYVEQAKNDLDWYRLLTEIQMYLHDHPVNLDRQDKGLYPINSFWFWGGGESLYGGTDQVIYSDDELVRQFFNQSAKRVTSLEETAAFREPSVVVSLRLFASLKSVHADSLEDILLGLEQSIFAPAVESMQRRGKTVRLRAGWQQDFELHPLHSWRFWRKRLSISDFAGAELGFG